MAIAQRESRNVGIVVPEGAIVKVLDGPFDHGLVDVRSGSEVLMMFVNDVEFPLIDFEWPNPLSQNEIAAPQCDW